MTFQKMDFIVSFLVTVVLKNGTYYCKNTSFPFHIICKNMESEESLEPERESFIHFPKPSEESHSSGERWHLLGTRVPQAEIVYFCQMIIVYIIIITSIVNLSLQNGSTELWISLLSSCIGYALPNPKLKK